MRFLLILVMVLLMGCPPVSSPGGDGDTGPRSKIGDTPAELDAEYVTGDGPRTLAEARGKIVLLEIWATFCDPCRRSFPKYQKLVGEDLTVIAIALDDPADVDVGAIKAFVAQTGATFPILWDKKQLIMQRMKVPRMPTAFLIDRKGVLRASYTGYQASTLDAIAGDIDALIAEGPAAETEP